MQVTVEEESNSTPHTGGARADESVISRRTAGVGPRVTSEEDVTVGRSGSGLRPLKESTRKLLAEMEPAQDLETEGDALATAAPDGKPDAVDEPHPDTARAERLTEQNRKLVADLAAARGRPTRAELTAREKALDEAERSYFSDPLAAHRRLIAAAHGTDALDAKEIERELEFLLEELTSKKIGVPLTREAEDSRRIARTLAGIERDKRERKEAEAKAATPAAGADPAAADVAKMTEIIGGRLAANGHAEKYPLLTALADDPLVGYGLKPAALLAAAINEGFATGELDRKTSDADLIEYASKHFEKTFETRYQDLVVKYGKAKPSTAAKPAANESSGKNAGPAGKAARTITSASASVAPATTPAKKTQATPVEPPKYASEKEKRLAIIAKHTHSVAQ